MCGIAGIVSGEPDQVDLTLVSGMGESLTHRGPDGVRFLQWSAGGPPLIGSVPRIDQRATVAFVHRRLAIIDRTPGADQPMSSPDGRHHLVYNGELYNYKELRGQLARDWSFRTVSDTEVLLAALVVWGRAALDRMYGMYAFALFDSMTGRMLLGRDPLGIKPLYLARLARGMAFASETTALLRLPLDRRADPQMLYDFLVHGRSDHGSRTLFASIDQLPAGETLEFDADSPLVTRFRSYWRPGALGRVDASVDDAALRVRELMIEATTMHLRADVPVGTALSGGIDSSSIVALIRRIEPSTALHAVSYLAGTSGIDETKWVNEASAHTSAELHPVRVRAEEMIGDLDRLIASQGLPFGSTSIYAQYRVFEAAQQAGLTVMLDGQGADELFGGYRWYLAIRLAELVRKGRLGAAVRLVRKVAARQTVVARAALDLLPPPARRVLSRAIGHPEVPGWLDLGWFAERAVETAPVPAMRAGLRATVDRDLTFGHLPALLRYEDRNSMTWSIESRVPFLHRPLVDYVTSLPESLLLGEDGTTKPVLRQAMRGIVPDSILDRRDKIGFATPEREWLADAWCKEVVSSDAAARVPCHVSPSRSQVARGPAWWRYLNVVRWTDQFEVTYG